jgi:FtsP/CotA-like multicopper oxidase with cupredoxin domain
MPTRCSDRIARCPLSGVHRPVLHALAGLLAATSLAYAGAERVSVNDNRTPAGTAAQGILTLRLEARQGEWRPDGDTGQPLTVKAFAVGGGPLQVPGPLIRVVEGSEVRAVIENRLDTALGVHGLYTRPAPSAAAIVIAPGAEHEFRFVAGQPGTYFYWAATDAATTIVDRRGVDSQLSGAFIVDPRGSAATDRVFVIGAWSNGRPPGDAARISRYVMNGRSWPATERLAYAVGDRVHMRLINAGADVHPMHLHGFYFNVDSRGDEGANTLHESTASAHLVVTERLAPGRTFSLTWHPTRPGNWLFHCHDNVHLEHGGPLNGGLAPPVRGPRHVANHAEEMMAGPVLGITVTGTSTEPAPAPDAARRHLRLVARVDAGGTPADPAFGYTLDDGSGRVPPPPYLPGPLLLLKRGEPVTITVANELPEATAVHWHGIELESYYDGVPDYAGEGSRVARPIPSGGSFEAKFTPPRSGTFIYHTHLDDVRQQQAGLTGALLVVDDPATFDAEHDLVLMTTVPRRTADADVVFLNGTATPPARVWRVGQRYRLRFINVHTFRPSMRMRLLQGDRLVRWRALAKDGMDLPRDRAVDGTAEVQMGNGETYDFEFTPSASGDLRLDVTSGDGQLLVSMPIRVDAP